MASAIRQRFPLLLYRQNIGVLIGDLTSANQLLLVFAQFVHHRFCDKMRTTPCRYPLEQLSGNVLREAEDNLTAMTP